MGVPGEKRCARGERLEVRMINGAGAAPRAEEADGAMINLNELLSAVPRINCERGGRRREGGGRKEGVREEVR